MSREELLRGPKGLSTRGVAGFRGEQTGSQGSLVLESGRWARAKAYPAAGDLALGPESIHNWRWRGG